MNDFEVCHDDSAKSFIIFFLFLFFISHTVSASNFSYDVSFSFNNLNYLLNRGSHSINDQEFFEFEPALIYNNKSNLKAKIKPRLKIDFLDANHNRYIPNEAFATFYSTHFELKAGFDVVSWGVANFYNPVDVVCRSDLGGNFYNAKKMGELILSTHFSFDDVGFISQPVLEIGVLPWLQEMPLPANTSRFAIAGDFNGIPFTLGDDQDYPNYARSLGAFAKLGGTIKGADVALLFYHGPDHNPAYYLTTDSNGALRVQPFYYALDMLGLTFEGGLGHFVAHLEMALKMTGLNAFKTHNLPGATDSVIPQSSLQYVPGFDYTIETIFGKGSASLTVEFLGESFGGSSFQDFRPFKRDLLLGVRYEFNNATLTKIEAGVLKDLQSTELISMIDFESKIYRELKLNLQAALVNRDGASSQPLSFFENNSYVMTKLSYKFGGKI